MNTSVIHKQKTNFGIDWSAWVDWFEHRWASSKHLCTRFGENIFNGNLIGCKVVQSTSWWVCRNSRNLQQLLLASSFWDFRVVVNEFPRALQLFSAAYCSYFPRIENQVAEVATVNASRALKAFNLTFLYQFSSKLLFVLSPVTWVLELSRSTWFEVVEKMKFRACFPISVLSLADYSNDFNLLFYKSFSGAKEREKLQ